MVTTFIPNSNNSKDVLDLAIILMGCFHENYFKCAVLSLFSSEVSYIEEKNLINFFYTKLTLNTILFSGLNFKMFYI